MTEEMVLTKRKPVMGDSVIVTAQRLAAYAHTGTIVSGPGERTIFRVQLDRPLPLFNGLPLEYVILARSEFDVIPERRNS